MERGGKYIARAKTEKTLTVAQICAEAVTRGGSDLNYDTMLEAVNAYFNEAFYQLADGFSIQNDFFSIHPKISGTFDRIDSGIDKDKNRVSFSFIKRQALRDIIKRITVEIEGAAETGAYIAEVLDITSGLVDEILTSGGVFTLLGTRIKIVGDDPSCGLYLVNTADGSVIKVEGNLVENHPSRVSAQTPALAAGTYRVRITTQFSTGAILKEPRSIEYGVELVVS